MKEPGIWGNVDQQHALLAEVYIVQLLDVQLALSPKTEYSQCVYNILF